ncbi:hypothetical protein TNCV_4761511 [Trichonephila clavipes]|uniref:Uncharacterized protein n=1 Tax=Trichonephila clavipes TaxID=2585209 RepID=A0A8X6V314_TRICX|nr:hypothetical protein TNCV_4761511 [Trichonephila clavipes]
MKWMHLGEKTCQFNETSPPISVRKQRICPLNETSGCDKKTTIGIVRIDTISPWCTRKCQSSRVPHRAGGQAGCGHSSPGNEAIFPD